MLAKQQQYSGRIQTDLLVEAEAQEAGDVADQQLPLLHVQRGWLQPEAWAPTLPRPKPRSKRRCPLSYVCISLEVELLDVSMLRCGEWPAAVGY